MKIRHGNMLHLPDSIMPHLAKATKPLLILITCNGTIKKGNELVMGRGAALKLRLRYPTMPRVLCEAALQNGKLEMDMGGKLYCRYGLAVPVYKTLKPKAAYYGAFQVKDQFYNPASLDLIKYSVDCLNVMLDYEDVDVWLNYPGIGNGQLTEEQVEPVIRSLPDKVTVWKHEISTT